MSMTEMGAPADVEAVVAAAHTRPARRARTVHTDTHDSHTDPHAERGPMVAVSPERREELSELAGRLHPQDDRTVALAAVTDLVLKVGLSRLREARVPTLAEIAAAAKGGR